MIRPSKLLLSVFFVGILVTGCGRSPPTATEVYRQFHESLVGMARGGGTGGASAAYALLSKDSQDQLVTLADQLNDTLPASVERRQPADLLRLRRLVVGDALGEIVERTVDEDHVALAVKVGDAAFEVTMKREGPAWRVVWPLASREPSAEAVSAPEAAP